MRATKPMKLTATSLLILAPLSGLSCGSPPSDREDPAPSSISSTPEPWSPGEEAPIPPLLWSENTREQRDVVTITAIGFPDTHEYSPCVMNDREVSFVSRTRDQLDIWGKDFTSPGAASFVILDSDCNEKAPFLAIDGNGRAKCFYATDSGGRFQVFTGYLPKVKSQQWEVRSAGDANWPNLSANGRLLLYSAVNGQGVYDIWMHDMQDGSDKKLTEGQRARWNPDGEKSNEFVYTREDSGVWNIWRFDVVTGSKEKLNQGSQDHFDAAFSPDGKFIAFTSNSSGSSDIGVMDAKTLTTIQVTTHGAIDCQPEWTKDGKSILFTSNRGTSWDIYRVSMEDIVGPSDNQNPVQ
jgi:Tol biopolymer transport system component